jgi:hypothetical protein
VKGHNTRVAVLSSTSTYLTVHHCSQQLSDLKGQASENLHELGIINPSLLVSTQQFHHLRLLGVSPVDSDRVCSLKRNCKLRYAPLPSRRLCSGGTVPGSLLVARQRSRSGPGRVRSRLIVSTSSGCITRCLLACVRTSGCASGLLSTWGIEKD